MSSHALPAKKRRPTKEKNLPRRHHSQLRCLLPSHSLSQAQTTKEMSKQRRRELLGLQVSSRTKAVLMNPPKEIIRKEHWRRLRFQPLQRTRIANPKSSYWIKLSIRKPQLQEHHWHPRRMNLQKETTHLCLSRQQMGSNQHKLSANRLLLRSR